MSDIKEEDLAKYVKNQLCGDYPVWKKDPYHIPFYEDEHMTLYTGTIPPNTATGYHQHNKDTFYVVLATGVATNDIIETREKEPEHKEADFIEGKGLVYEPVRPYVHRVVSHDKPLCFIGIESKLLRRQSVDVSLGAELAVGSAGVHSGSGRVTPLEARSHFGSGLTYKLQPGDNISLPQYKSTDIAPLARVVVHLAGDWSKLEITAPDSAEKNLRTEGNTKRIIDMDVLVAVLGGTDVFVPQTITDDADVEKNGPCMLKNTSDSVWEGVVVDIFGLE